MASPNPPSGMANGAAALKGILNETIGPMAVLTAGAIAFVKYTAGAALNAAKMAAALRASADAKRLEGQFRLILGSSEAARKKVSELSKEAARSPFSFEALGKAAMNLQVLSDGAFASSAALQQVQDVAVATGTPVDVVASAMGDLVGSLKRGGDGAGNAASQLASMGAITQQTAQKVASLAQAGAPASESMRLVEADTKKARGAAAELAGSIDGLQQQLQNLQTASDTKIGAMFEEGEKAGLRAAIGFQKFNNAVQEAASGPWATIIGGLNVLKESLANVFARAAQTGIIQTALKAIGAVSVVVFSVLISSVLSGVAALLKLAMQLRVVQAVTVASGATFRAWFSLMGFARLGVVLLASALVGLAARAAAAKAAVTEAFKEIARSGRDSSKMRGEIAQKAFSATTPEELSTAQDAARQNLQAAQEELDNAKRDLTEKQAALQNVGWLAKLTNIPGTLGLGAKDLSTEIAAANVITAESNVQSKQQQYQAMLQLMQQIQGIGQATLALDIQRTEESRKRAEIESQIAKDARLAAAQMGAGSALALEVLAAEASANRIIGETASQRVSEGNKQISEAQDNSPAQAAIDKINASYENKIKALDQEPPSQLVDVRRAKLVAEQQSALENIYGGSYKSRFGALQAVEKNAPKDDFGITALNSQIAQRQMVAEMNTRLKVLGAMDIRTPEQFAEMASIRKNLPQYTEAVGGADKATPAAIAQLQAQRSTLMNKIDPEKLVNSDVQAQAALQAQKVADAEVQASIQKLRNETLIAQLKKSGAEVAQQELQAQLKAAQALKLAMDNRALTPEPDATAVNAARQKIDAVSQEAAKAQVASVVEAKQLLEAVKKDPALEQQFSGQLEAAKKLVDAQNEYDALIAPSKEAQANLNAAQIEAQKVGLGDQTSEELKAKILAAEENRVMAVGDMQKGAQISALRVQERYGPNQREARDQANALEDEMKVKQRAKELGDIIPDTADAQKVAGLQVQMERSQSNIDQMGQLPVSELASVGGSAGWAGLVNDPTEEIKKLNKTSEEMKKALQTILTKADESRALAEKLASQ